jgi:23S rRNA (pseudouridine1915-N3)-methyltransferase
MLIAVNVVGRMKAGPEQELAARYFDRLARSGPGIGLEFAGVIEIAEGRSQSPDERRRDEAARLRNGIGSDAALIALDERGRSITSEQFAQRIGGLRDGGRRAAAFVLGGPDGLDPSLRAAAELVVSFGQLTWPHQLARIMLAEQLYRAVTILSGHPYHRA